MITINSCPVCGNSQFTALTSCIDYTVSHETFKIISCATCGFTFTSPRPDNETLGQYYQSEKYISHSNKAQSFMDKIYLLARSFTLKWKIDLIQKKFPEQKTLQILDYGCGTGEFLKACQEKGFTIAGVEPSEIARLKSSDLNRIKIHEYIEALKEEKYDVITLWHVLEHIPNFENIIQKLKSKLSDNGILLIAVPNLKSFDAQHYKQYWAGFDVPRHLWHFSSDAIKRLFSKNNLTLIDICGMKLDSYYVSLLSEKYKSTKGIVAYINAVIIGTLSNWKARRTGNYSSLIYIVKK